MFDIRTRVGFGTGAGLGTGVGDELPIQALSLLGNDGFVSNIRTSRNCDILPIPAQKYHQKH